MNIINSNGLQRRRNVIMFYEQWSTKQLLDDPYQGLVDVFGWASVGVGRLDESQLDVEFALSQKLHHESGDWKEEDKSGDMIMLPCMLLK